MRFDQHTLVLLVTPAGAPDLPDDEAAAVQDAHLASQAELYDKGLLLAAGPFDGQDDQRLRGIAILSVPPDEARRLYAADPAVRAGRLAVQAMTWLVPSGTVAFERGRLPRSMDEAADAEA
jgi:uncharacterized protein YciI